MQHGAHAGDGVIGLQVAGAVPHERPNPVARAYARIVQGVGQLVRPVPGLPKGLPPSASHRGGDDLHVAGHRSAPVE